VLLTDSLTNTYPYVLIGTDYDTSIEETTLSDGLAYIIPYPNHAFIVMIAEDLNAEFEFSYYYADKGVNSDS